MTHARSTFVLLAFLAAAPLGSQHAWAQASAAAPPAPSSGPTQVITANPLGLLIGWFNGEYQHKLNDSLSLGVGGSVFDLEDDNYVNGDVFVRFFPSGRVFEGFSVSAKAGPTRMRDNGTGLGVGVDVDWNWLLGRDKRYAVILGFGLKRIVTSRDRLDITPPTLHVVNLGLAF